MCKQQCEGCVNINCSSKQKTIPLEFQMIHRYPNGVDGEQVLPVSSNGKDLKVLTYSSGFASGIDNKSDIMDYRIMSSSMIRYCCEIDYWAYLPHFNKDNI